MDENNVLASHSTDKGLIEISIPQNYVVIGEEVDIDITFRGKEAHWDVKNISLTLNVPYRTENGFQQVCFDQFSLLADASFGTELAETRTSTITIPWTTPETVGSVDVIASVEVALEQVIETYEQCLDVTAPQLQAVFTSMVELGFAPRGFECVEETSSKTTPFVQRLEFKSVQDPFQSELDRVELLCRSDNGVVTVSVVVNESTESPVTTEWTSSPQTRVEQSNEDAVRDHLESFLEQTVTA